MFLKLHKLYVKKIDELLGRIENKFLPVQNKTEEIDVYKNNIESLNPESFVDFNNSNNAVLSVLCDEQKLENYCVKLRNINVTIKSNKDIYNLLYTTPIHNVRISTFFLSDLNSYTNEFLLVSNFKERALEYILAYNLLKESDNNKDQLNHLRLTSFTNNLNDTVCSLLKLQTLEV